MHHWFTPARFESISRYVLPIAVLMLIGFSVSGLYFALFDSPPDYQQGETVRIMYIHVPAAWMALGVYVGMAIAGISTLVWRNPISGMVGIASARVGALYTAICLVTGMLWGKPMWGAWWVWDARLTSVLILFFFYLGYIALYNAFDDREHAEKMSAILSLVGVINIPIVKFSVDWWNTLHQPASLFRKGGSAIDASMLHPLLLMWGAYVGYFLLVLILSVKSQMMARKIERVRLRNA